MLYFISLVIEVGFFFFYKTGGGILLKKTTAGQNVMLLLLDLGYSRMDAVGLSLYNEFSHTVMLK